MKPLKVRPSFTEITREVGKAHGVEIVAQVRQSHTSMTRDARDRGRREPQKAINNLTAPIPETVAKALTALRNAIDKTID